MLLQNPQKYQGGKLTYSALSSTLFIDIMVSTNLSPSSQQSKSQHCNNNEYYVRNKNQRRDYSINGLWTGIHGTNVTLCVVLYKTWNLIIQKLSYLVPSLQHSYHHSLIVMQKAKKSNSETSFDISFHRHNCLTNQLTVNIKLYCLL